MKNTQSSGVPFIPFIRGGVKENDIEASFFYILPAAFPSQKSLFAEHSTLDWALLQCAVLRAHWSVRVYYPIANEKQCSWRRCVLRLAARDNFIATRFVSIGSWWPVAWHTLKTSCFFFFFFSRSNDSPLTLGLPIAFVEGMNGPKRKCNEIKTVAWRVYTCWLIYKNGW